MNPIKLISNIILYIYDIVMLPFVVLWWIIKNMWLVLVAVIVLIILYGILFL